MLSAIYYGAMYGGTITSVLINVPGEAASVITCIDGYQMARQGRGGTALGIAAIGSFVGGIVATIALVVVALPLAQLALKFGPPEFFALMLVGLCLITGLGGQSLLAGLVMAVLGLLIALVGIDPVRGAPRFTFGIPSLYDGVASSLWSWACSSPRFSHHREALPPGDQDQPQLADALARGMAAFGRRHRTRHRHRLLPGLIPGVGAIIRRSWPIVEKRISKTPKGSAGGSHARQPLDRQQRLCQRRHDPVHAGYPEFADHRGADGRSSSTASRPAHLPGTP